MPRGIRPSTLARMSNDQLKKSGYVRIPGFTKTDGTKVKAHIRMLAPSTGGKETTKQFAELAVDFTPIIGDIKAGAEAFEAFSDKDYLAGAVLTVGAIVGVIPVIGDAAKIPIKAFAKTLKASTKAQHSTARVAVDLVDSKKKSMFGGNDSGAFLKQAKADRLTKAKTKANRKLRLQKELAESGDIVAKPTRLIDKTLKKSSIKKFPVSQVTTHADDITIKNYSKLTGAQRSKITREASEQGHLRSASYSDDVIKEMTDTVSKNGKLVTKVGNHGRDMGSLRRAVGEAEFRGIEAEMTLVRVLKNTKNPNKIKQLIAQEKEAAKILKAANIKRWNK